MDHAKAGQVQDNYDIKTGDNYDQALQTIVTFANRAGVVLQHVEFDEFRDAMISDEPFRLG